MRKSSSRTKDLVGPGTGPYLTIMTIPQENSWHRRESLYNKFIAATAERYANALTQESDDPNALMKLYALVGKMRRIVPESVIAAAEAATINVQKAYEAPNRSLRQIHIFSAEGDVDPLLDFSKACREDLKISREILLR